MALCTITFNIEGGDSRRGESCAVEVPAETSLLEAARKADVAIDAPCGGNGTCGKCRVQLVSGEIESEGPGRHITEADYAEGFRLACQSRVKSPLTVIQVPAGALAYQTRIKIADLSVTRDREIFAALQKELAEMFLGGELGLELLRLSLPPPSLDDAAADRERLFRAAAELCGVEESRFSISLYALRKLPQTLRESNFTVDCVIRSEGEEKTILNVYPHSEESPPSFSDAPPRLAGLAIDIGTTTVSMMLVDLETGEMAAMGSAGNGQIRYGADVINRIIESGKRGGLERLHNAVTKECIEPLIRRICEKAGITPDRIYRAAVAANTTMTHFFLGVNGENIRLEPYVPAFFHSSPFSAQSLALGLHPDAEVLIAPGIGSYVGGDITAGVFSSMIFKKTKPSLLIDLGTNGELVFGSADFLMACACSAGPAFEGGDIACGMRATDGAIEAVVVDKESMKPALSIVGAENGQKPRGLCGSGLIDLIGELFRCGIINAKGKFIREDPGPNPRVAHDEYGGGRYIAAFPNETADGGEVSLTEVDIDNFIRAKGAIFSAIKTMLAVVDYPVDAIEDIFVAGGIGSGINMKSAIRIGMFPNLPLEKFHYIGNSSLMGAYAMLQSKRAAEMVTDTARGITYLELSSHPGYMDEFVAACFLPHTDAGLFNMAD
jgi:uncharacterized 2Fe-2S/4Fe-4S cluster protein (DUF4445 family)